MSTDVTDAELAACADVLRRLQPSDLDGDADNMRELRAAGLSLFRRPVLHERHGEQDVVEFLKEQAGYRTMLGKLERLQKRIDAEHEKREARKSRMVARKSSMQSRRGPSKRKMRRKMSKRKVRREASRRGTPNLRAIPGEQKRRRQSTTSVGEDVD